MEGKTRMNNRSVHFEDRGLPTASQAYQTERSQNEYGEVCLGDMICIHAEKIGGKNVSTKGCLIILSFYKHFRQFPTFREIFM